MKIYTSQVGGQKLATLKELELGVMLAPLGNTKRDYEGVSLAMDNGAFRSWTLGYPFMERLFLHELEANYKRGWELDFIVCPDLIARGYESLYFSLEWAKRLRGARLALAVQDGMTPIGVHERTADAGFTTIFVGGTMEWKWKMAGEWVTFSHDYGMQCHIGRCGTLNAIDKAAGLEVDSVDSSNLARNDSWDVVREFRSKERLFV